MDLYLCDCGRKYFANMPKDSINIDEIMDKIHERRAGENRKGPKTIPKAVLRKYQNDTEGPNPIPKRTSPNLHHPS